MQSFFNFSSTQPIVFLIGLANDGGSDVADISAAIAYVNSKTPLNSTTMSWLIIPSRMLAGHSRHYPISWRCNDLETLSVLLAICEENTLVPELFGLSQMIAHHCMFEVQWWKRLVHMQSGHNRLYDIHLTNESDKCWAQFSTFHLSTSQFNVPAIDWKLCSKFFQVASNKVVKWLWAPNQMAWFIFNYHLKIRHQMYDRKNQRTSQIKRNGDHIYENGNIDTPCFDSCLILHVIDWK